ncbi:MAG: Asp/Glu/hydantoin racemase [Bacteroidetes bacterium]|jgi:Asp/Glu/hydantoin racemase|nr:Asp/Glu/hydantoin racemase [Bacteroidota bacterium]
MKKLGLIHTSSTLVPTFQKLSDKYLQDVEVFNIVDDSLISDVIDEGRVTPNIACRVIGQVFLAEKAGADLIMVTCSSIGEAVEKSSFFVNTRVLRVDQPMVDMAVEKGSKIGVLATLPTTLKPTSRLVNRRAGDAGKKIELASRLCDGAFDALMMGEADKHDQMVAEALKELSDKVDIIVLAQASMARVVNQLSDAQKKVPILESPELGVQHLASIM